MVGIEVNQKAGLMVEIVVGLEVCWWWDSMCDWGWDWWWGNSGETTSGPGSLLMVGMDLGLFANEGTGTVGLLGLAQCLPAVGPGHLTDWSLRFPLLLLV